MRYIYVIHNPKNNKVYIGQTKNFNNRMADHKCSAKNITKNIPIYNAINKYGFDNLNKIILDYVEDCDADKEETAWIEYFNSCNDSFGYNLESGGCTNKSLSSETKKKISETKKRKHMENPLGHHSLGKICSEETKKKISDANKGKCFNSKEHMNKLHKLNSLLRKGSILPEETKYKISKSRKGFEQSELAKQKMSETRIKEGAFAKEKNPMFGKTGELNPASKFTQEIADNIRKDYSNGIKVKNLCYVYNISETNI